MRELIEKVRQWGLDRGIVYTGAEGQDKQAMMEAQARYTLKETAELLDAYADQDIDKINDAIGDILVTLIVGASSDDKSYRGLLSHLSGDHYTLSYTSDFDFTSAYMDLVSHASFLVKKSKFDIPANGYYKSVVLRLEQSLKSANLEFDQELSLKDCLELAYNEIKNRTGKVVNGQFIKDK